MKKKMSKKDSLAVPKDIVKEIFDKPKSAKRRISALFTPYKGQPKVIFPPRKRPEISYKIKPLPIAIDIGTKLVKIMRLGESERKQLEIICIDHERCETSVKDALRKLMERNRVGTFCVSSLPARHVELYNMSFPPMPEKELRSAVQYKVSQLKPFGLARENVITRWKTWEGQRVIIACVPREVVVEHISTLKDSGFHPVSLGVPQFSLGNLAKFYKPTEHKNEVTLWVHIGKEESFLAIEKDRKLCFVRKIGLTSDQVEEVMSSPLTQTLSPEGRGKGEGPVKEEAALISLLENMVVDIEHSFKYFSYQIAQSRITRFNRVILTGEAAHLKDVDKFLSARLSVPVECFNTFAMFKIPENMQDERGHLLNTPANFAMATALSLGQKFDRIRQLNFLPEEEKGIFKALKDGLKSRPVQIGAIALAGIVLLIGTQLGRVSYYKTKMHSTRREFKMARFNIAKLQAQELELNKEEAGLLRRKEILETQLGLLTGEFRTDRNLSRALVSVASLLPGEIWLNELKYEEGRLMITGSTLNLALITRLIENIKHSKEFVGADFNYTQKKSKKEDVYSFEIVADIKT
ncbi:MAG: pilus assembly protein PilM [Candidatus Omnitrophota bacterium]|nr:MAG: pilus assembly protein PilM [Candidatus Omnitrophota bacterium]